MGNEEKYCDIMFANAGRTSKSKLPALVNDLLTPDGIYPMRFVLDVGCADGRFTRCLKDSLPDDVGVIGMEPNRQRYNKAIKQMNGDGRLSFINNEFNESYSNGRGDFDCVLFSSSMHEIASSAGENKDRWTQRPIERALERAYGLLRKDGVVVVRDMVVPPRPFELVTVKLRHEVWQSLMQTWVKKLPFSDRMPEEAMCCNIDLATYADTSRFVVSRWLLLEFLMCATWGHAAWRRERMERKLILSKSGWERAFKKAGFTDVKVKTYTEEYPEHFDKIADVRSPSGWKWPRLSITVTGRKPE